MVAGKRHKGFTLIELMIAVAIVGILAAIAYPAYTSQVRRGVRSNAQAQMMDIANRQQQYLLTNRRYATTSELTATGYALPGELSNKYDWEITATAANTTPAFTVTFTAKGGQSADGNLTLNSEGSKAPADKW